MCGIIGHVAFLPEARIAAPLFEGLNNLLTHRGPDSGGIYIDGPTALGMRRLSIVDVSDGYQPMTSEDGRFTIVFNGEIYNYKALRAELEAAGAKLKTRSDTEVLLESFIRQGPQCLRELNGMFAFAVWDRATHELFLARDHTGMKPLYFTQNAHQFMFSSELTPLIKSKLFALDLNYRAILDCLSYWYICEPKTIIEGIQQLKPGSYAVLKNGEMRVSTYWEIPSVPMTPPLSYHETLEALHELVKDSIRLRMDIQEVPFGTFLSGGVDSGLISAIAAQIHGPKLSTYSIGFKEKSYSELDMATVTANHIGANLVTTSIDTFNATMLDEIFRLFDEPLGNASFVPTYFLAKRASRDLKVVLTGDGGDELFGGYPTYQAPYYQRLYRMVPAGVFKLFKYSVEHLPVSHNRISLDYKLKQLMKGLPETYQKAHFTWREVTTRELQKELIKPKIFSKVEDYNPFEVSQNYFDKAKGLSIKNQLMYVDLNTYLLNDHLRKVDRMTMACSLEARIPFLDHRIVELAAGMPEEYKVNFLTTKRILKDLARRYLPKPIVAGKKKGLTSPISFWISNDVKDYVRDNVKGGLASEVFESDALDRLLDDHFAKRRDYSRSIWSILALQMWDKYIYRSDP